MPKLAPSEAQIEARFFDGFTPEPNSGCWLWLGNVYGGYGRMQMPGRKNIGAHVYSYRKLIGPVPAGARARNAAKTVCKRGHAFGPQPKCFSVRGYRRCNTCHREAEAARRARLSTHKEI